jgi:hypothetical protein
MTRLEKSKDSDANPGHLFLNFPDIPKDANGEIDGTEMRGTVASAAHRSTATGRMNWPDGAKTWVFRVYSWRM